MIQYRPRKPVLKNGTHETERKCSVAAVQVINLQGRETQETFAQVIADSFDKCKLVVDTKELLHIDYPLLEAMYSASKKRAIAYVVDPKSNVYDRIVESGFDEVLTVAFNISEALTALRDLD